MHPKKILMLSFRFPYPLTEGSILRLYNLGVLLSRGYRTDIVVVSERPESRDAINVKELERIFGRVFVFPFNLLRFRVHAIKGLFSRIPLQTSYYYFREVQQWIDRHYGEYDLLWCHHIRMAEYLKNVQRPRVIDLVDATSNHYRENKQWASGIWKFILSVETKRTLAYELKQIGRFDRSFITSPFDKEYIDNHNLKHSEKLILIPNGVREELLSRSGRLPEEDRIVFLGGMTYAPNIDAVTCFVKNVYPLIKTEFPNLKFTIVGTSPTRKVRKLSEIKGVEVTGFVEDPWAYVERAKVIVAPLRFGGGIQNKILEAMALRKPIVTTSRGARGIEGKPGEHFLVADGNEEMAGKIIDLLRNKDLRIALGRKARELVENNYRWHIIGEKLLSEIDKILTVTVNKAPEEQVNGQQISTATRTG
jgi:sugar transferase (PEP-CTERM/EpsH1 system associated)